MLLLLSFLLSSSFLMFDLFELTKHTPNKHRTQGSRRKFHPISSVRFLGSPIKTIWASCYCNHNVVSRIMTRRNASKKSQNDGRRIFYYTCSNNSLLWNIWYTRLSKSFILTKIPYPNIMIKKIIKYICFVFCHHLDYLWILH